MLSRTAENLYWTSRYLERADSIARLLEVAYRISLIPNTQEGYNNEWESILATSGTKEEYLSLYKQPKKEKIEFFLLFDNNNFSSVKNCIEKARDNIKMVRTAVTLEVWNAVNTLFYRYDEFVNKKYNSKELPEILDLIKRQVNLIKGTIINTQLLNDGFDFLTLGNYFERADFTARIIDVKYFILLPSSSFVGTQVDNFQWSLMLRSVSSYRAFKWAYGNSEIDYIKIIDFLVLNSQCPRSLFFSVEKIYHHLNRLKKNYGESNVSLPKINQIYKRLKTTSVNTILDEGLHDFLSRFIKDISSVYQSVEKKYFMSN
ncbi:MAG: hypothetical protein CBE11_00075 [Rickettsiales bacterium TMED251]|nr:MAG: hypothetical protein CBE11_00075 [Rickettsiales bacterium TMED251]